jgi:hypothetical protein
VVEVLAFPDAEDTSVDLTYCFGDVSYSAQAEQVRFREDRSVTVSGDGSYFLNAVYNEGEYASCWYGYTVEGTCQGDVSLYQNADGYTIVEGENLDGIRITVENRDKEVSEVVQTQEDSILITNDGEELLLLCDPDHDGIYDTNVLEPEEVVTEPTEETAEPQEEEPEGDEKKEPGDFPIGLVIGAVVIVAAAFLFLKGRKKPQTEAAPAPQVVMPPQQAAPRICPYCGNPLGDDAAFCGNCGNKVV